MTQQASDAAVFSAMPSPSEQARAANEMAKECKLRVQARRMGSGPCESAPRSIMSFRPPLSTAYKEFSAQNQADHGCPTAAAMTAIRQPSAQTCAPLPCA
eukprot:4991856-Prymnesium_polylepis.1